MVLVGLIAFAFLLAGQMSPVVKADVNSDWPMFQHDLAHTGYAAVNATSNSIQELWNHSIGANSISPIVANGIVYAGDNGFIALNATTGTTIWTTSSLNQRGFSAQGQSIIANGILYFGTDDGYLYALDASTGTELWGTYAYQEPGFSGTAVNGEILRTLGDELSIINASTGYDIGWFTGDGALWGLSNPAVVNNIVYTGDDYVYAINLSATQDPQGLKYTNYGYEVLTSHDLMWTFPVAYHPFTDILAIAFGPPTVADGVVYVGTEYNVTDEYATTYDSGRLMALMLQLALPSGTIQLLVESAGSLSMAITFTAARATATCLPLTNQMAALSGVTVQAPHFFPILFFLIHHQ